MQQMVGTRVKVQFAFLLVFLLGFAAGALSLTVYHRRIEAGRAGSCEPSNAPIPSTSRAMKARPPSAMAPIIKARCGAGCSAHLRLRTCTFIWTLARQCLFWNHCFATWTLRGSAQPVKSLTVTPRLLQEVASHKRGPSAKRCVHGGS